MFGQAPYVVNGILNYSNDSIGFSSTLSYNIQGPKLAFTSVNLAPDVYEMPRHQIDLKLSKSLTKNFSLSFAIKDLLNTARRRAYKYKEGYILDFDSYRFGTNYSINISYKL